MKIEMKKYLILFVFFFNLNLGFAQSLPEPTPPGACPCCDDFIDENTGSPFPGSETDYANCESECTAGNNPCVPIDSAILVLVVLGASLGIFKVYQNKKRQFEN